MEYLKFLFTAPWELMQLEITLFGFTFTLAEMFLFSFVIGLVGYVIHIFSE